MREKHSAVEGDVRGGDDENCMTEMILDKETSKFSTLPNMIMSGFTTPAADRVTVSCVKEFVIRFHYSGYCHHITTMTLLSACYCYNITAMTLLSGYCCNITFTRLLSIG